MNPATSPSAWKKTSWCSPRVRNAYTGRVPHNTRVIRSPPDSMHCASLGYDTAHLAHLRSALAERGGTVAPLRCEGSDAIGAKRTGRERRERVDLTKMTPSRHSGRRIAAVQT